MEPQPALFGSRGVDLKAVDDNKHAVARLGVVAGLFMHHRRRSLGGEVVFKGGPELAESVEILALELGGGYRGNIARHEDAWIHPAHEVWGELALLVGGVAAADYERPGCEFHCHVGCGIDLAVAVGVERRGDRCRCLGQQHGEGGCVLPSEICVEIIA